MDTRSILALASGRDEDALVLDKAAELTALRNGQLTVLTTFEPPGYQLAMVPTGLVLDPHIINQLTADHEAMKADVTRRAAEAAKRAGLDGGKVQIEWVDASAWEALKLVLPVSDLVLTGPDAARSELVADILLRSRSPVMIVKPELRLELMCVAIAWDGSPSAGRALRAALPLLEGARRVVVLQHLAGLNEERRKAADVSRLKDYLALYGLEPDVEQLPGAGDSGEVIAQAARCCGADLMVCGAWGHWRLAELVLGGVTQSVLRSPWPSTVLAH